MLKQYDFSFSAKGIENIWSDIAVKVHGAIMNIIPDNAAKEMHKNKYHPFSIFSIPSEDKKSIITRVSSLNENGNIIVNSAFRMNNIIIKGIGKIDIIQSDNIYEKELQVLLNEVGGRDFRLVFITPSVFKKNCRI